MIALGRYLTKLADRARLHRRGAANVFATTVMLRVPGLALASLGQVLALPLLVVQSWGPRTRPFMRLLVAAALLADASGVFLLMWSVVIGGHSVSGINAVEVLAWPFLMLSGGAGIAWASTVIGVRRTMGAVALVGILDFCIVIRVWSEPWKFGIGQFVTMGVLVLMWDRSRRLTSLVMIPLILISLATATRSLALVQAAALLIGLLMWRREATQGRRWRAELAGITAVFVIGLAVLPAAASNGLLGSAIQTRYEQNTAGGQSVIVGARAEWVGAAALFGQRPSGFGPGVQPTDADKTAVRLAVLPLQEGAEQYFDDTVFQDRVDLHSGVLNAWYHLGFGGLVWIGLLLLVFGLGLLAIKPNTGGQIALAFAMIMGLWHLVYSPFLASTYVSSGLGFALLLLWRRAPRPAAGRLEAQNLSSTSETA